MSIRTIVDYLPSVYKTPIVTGGDSVVPLDEYIIGSMVPRGIPVGVPDGRFDIGIILVNVINMDPDGFLIYKMSYVVE